MLGREPQRPKDLAVSELVEVSILWVLVQWGQTRLGKQGHQEIRSWDVSCVEEEFGGRGGRSWGWVGIGGRGQGRLLERDTVEQRE